MDMSIERRLPEELLDHIVMWTDYDTLFYLCRVSKTMQRLVIPRVYSSLELDKRFDLARLAYLLLTSDDHAALVKRLYVRATWRSEEGIITRRSRWVEHVSVDMEEEVLRTRCAELGLGDAEANWWYNIIKHNDNEDAILALLLAHLPALQKLDIDFGDDEHSQFFTLFTQINERIRASGIARQQQPSYIDGDESGSERVPRFASSVDVMVKGGNDSSSFGSTHATTFLLLPTLRNFFAWKLNDDFTNAGVDTSAFARLQPQSCFAETIDLRMVKLDPVNLEYLMAAMIPGKLRSFDCEIGDPSFGRSIDHPRIMQGLKAHQNTLEQLSLSVTESYPYKNSDADRTNKPSACSFTDFTALKRLKVAPAFIWGHEGYFDELAEVETDSTETWRLNQLWRALPASLEELWLTRAHPACELPNGELPAYFVASVFLPSLDALLDRKDKVCPNLNRLVIQFPLRLWKKEWLRSLAVFCKKALKKGIERVEIRVGLGFLDFNANTPRDWGWNEDYVWKPCEDNFTRTELQLVDAPHGDLEQEFMALEKHIDAITEIRLEAVAHWVRCMIQEREQAELERKQIRLWRITM